MLDYFALFLLFFVFVTLFYGVIAIHDIPYELAKKRNHPQQDAIHIAGWASLFTLHVLWPFLWIWASLYREDRGWGFSETQMSNSDESREQIEQMQVQMDVLQQEMQALKAELINPSTRAPKTAEQENG